MAENRTVARIGDKSAVNRRDDVERRNSVVGVFVARPDDDPSPYDWEDEMTEPQAVREAILENRRRALSLPSQDGKSHD